jgi:hypothetical protein
MKEVVLTPSAQAELEGAMEWYEVRAGAIGQKFASCVDGARAINQESQAWIPSRWSPIRTSQRNSSQNPPSESATGSTEAIRHSRSSATFLSASSGESRSRGKGKRLITARAVSLNSEREAFTTAGSRPRWQSRIRPSGSDTQNRSWYWSSPPPRGWLKVPKTRRLGFPSRY